MKKIILSLVALVVLSCVSTYGQDKDTTKSGIILDGLLKMTDTVARQKKIEQLFKTGNEVDGEALVRFYNVKENRAMSDSAFRSTARRFPLGDYGFQSASMEVMAENDPAKQREKYLAMRKRFAHAANNRMGSGFVELSIAMKRIADKDLKGAFIYIDSIRTPSLLASAARGVYALDPAKAEEMLREIKSSSNNSGTGERNNGIDATYAHILISNGKIEEAAPLIKKVYAESTGMRRSDEIIGDYTTILRAENDYTGIITALEAAILEGKGTPDMRAQLAVAYQKMGKDTNSSFKTLNEALSRRIRQEVAPSMINNPTPFFTVRDINGKTVSLSDFKGKIVVLDFWATWCVPCKASFPAMQQVVNRYKNDGKVAFLFIHTWEHSAKEPLKDASQYLKSKNYTFDLYMDYYDSKTKTNPAVSAFKIEGIPTKYVIDRNGRIRFLIEGFNGGDEASAEEVSAMIELAKGDS
ncbi:TlpA disulfide reductase family protein [Mucilaginibacter sp. KACC 22773]|uniref:TlpA disulfide reductase family protein n=1 Tax=Mucilaginibacter sp. KACC 22773 TaxID=3025671 RepID=UPI0023656B32|nr:TlpA disulfide reductase family protein [Mucilaginibacter sp. KACC 22773]WDF77178.1 TlpA disulfide reductase family protein [Mucilaginibacter sp. KACC 22773]